MINYEKYCVQCDSEIGSDKSTLSRQDWCWVCNEPRRELPDTIMNEIRKLQAERKWLEDELIKANAELVKALKLASIR